MSPETSPLQICGGAGKVAVVDTMREEKRFLRIIFPAHPAVRSYEIPLGWNRKRSKGSLGQYLSLIQRVQNNTNQNKSKVHRQSKQTKFHRGQADHQTSQQVSCHQWTMLGTYESEQKAQAAQGLAQQACCESNNLSSMHHLSELILFHS